MGRGRGRRHGGRTTAALVMAAVIFTGCTPSPAPSPSPTGFASDEEAFAAAEATYRAYIDAVNASRMDQSSPVTPTSYLTADALEAELESIERFKNSGISLDGAIQVISVKHLAASYLSADIVVCLDVSETRVVNSSGKDVTPADREELVAARVTGKWTPTRVLISSSAPANASC